MIKCLWCAPISDLDIFIFQKYVAVAELGKATDTLDATGIVILEKDFGNNKDVS